MDKHISALDEALSCLPYRLTAAVLKRAEHIRTGICEIRLRVGRELYITCGGFNIPCGVMCTAEDMDHTVRRLCGNSLYSHSETIREGYITTPGGVRAGICGRAVVDRGEIATVTDIASLNIRIPTRVRGAADAAYALLEEDSFSSGLLVYSAPGVGKTTLLRELAVKLASGEKAMRVAIVDSRCEIAAGINEAITADILSGYPRGKGIEIAIRTLSPQYIICDEISSAQDAEAVLEAGASGVRIIASAHAGSYAELCRSEFMKNLNREAVFGTYLGLLGRDRRGKYKTEISKTVNLEEEILQATADTIK